MWHLGSSKEKSPEDSPSHRNRALPAIAKDSEDEAREREAAATDNAAADLSSKALQEIQIEHDENLRVHCNEFNSEVLNINTNVSTNGLLSPVNNQNTAPSQRDISKLGISNFLSINSTFEDVRSSNTTSRNVSFDGRSEHFELATPRIEVPKEGYDRRLSNNPLPSPNNSSINNLPPQNTDLSVILPDFHYGIPKWVLQVLFFFGYFQFTSSSNFNLYWKIKGWKVVFIGTK